MAGSVQGINPNIIKWARERSGYTLREVANFFKKDVTAIFDWESGNSAPTYAQLQKLADKFKRPIALFFFPVVPHEPDLARQLALRSTEIEKLGPDIRTLLRQASSRQISLMELNMGANPADRKIFRDFHFQLHDSVTELARQTREYFDINIEVQADWTDSTEALGIWREQVEEKGIYVFKDAFRNDFVDGFCLVHEQFPVIYLNNSRAHVRQIFSLFHELAHLLLGENGITRGIHPVGEQIEVFCNQFAAEFLVPSDHLETRLIYPVYNDAAIKELADYYKVSRPVILLKLVDRGTLTADDYKQKTAQWAKAHQARSQKGSGGDYYNTRAVYLGYRYLELAFGRYNQGSCSIEELSDHLNVKVKNLPRLEERLLRKITS